MCYNTKKEEASRPFRLDLAKMPHSWTWGGYFAILRAISAVRKIA
jgi:hypothetical protein